MSRLTFLADTERDTTRLAELLNRVIPDGTLVVLSGTLGAGKTTFVRDFASAAGVPSEDVTSPTYVLCQHYRGRRAICHLDLYRINSAEEVWDLAWDEQLEAGAVVLVEWGERFPACLPSDYLQVRIDILGDKTRRFELMKVGETQVPWWNKLAGEL